MFPFGWIYLLQERAHLGSTIFKIGRTIDISSRLKARDYRKSMLICAMYCPGVRGIEDETPNYKIAEENLKTSFVERFGPPVSGEGSETFQGEVLDMVDLIHRECYSRRVDWLKHEQFFNKYFVLEQKSEEISQKIKPREKQQK